MTNFEVSIIEVQQINKILILLLHDVFDLLCYYDDVNEMDLENLMILRICGNYAVHIRVYLLNGWNYYKLHHHLLIDDRHQNDVNDEHT